MVAPPPQPLAVVMLSLLLMESKLATVVILSRGWEVVTATVGVPSPAAAAAAAALAALAALTAAADGLTLFTLTTLSISRTSTAPSLLMICCCLVCLDGGGDGSMVAEEEGDSFLLLGVVPDGAATSTSTPAFNN